MPTTRFNDSFDDSSLAPVPCGGDRRTPSQTPKSNPVVRPVRRPPRQTIYPAAARLFPRSPAPSRRTPRRRPASPLRSRTSSNRIRRPPPSRLDGRYGSSRRGRCRSFTCGAATRIERTLRRCAASSACCWTTTPIGFVLIAVAHSYLLRAVCVPLFSEFSHRLAALKAQRAKSKEQRAKSKEQRAKSKEYRTDCLYPAQYDYALRTMIENIGHNNDFPN
jgi:hypothetical protein